MHNTHQICTDRDVSCYAQNPCISNDNDAHGKKIYGQHGTKIYGHNMFQNVMVSTVATILYFKSSPQAQKYFVG